MKSKLLKKNVIITGANSGIGFELAKKLINENYRVILACRNEEKGFKAEKKLGINSKFMKLDLSSYKSINDFSKKLRQEKISVNCLINNAGIMLHPNNILDNGMNITFFVNYISYFYLSLKIIDLLEKNNDSKIINVSSISSYSIKKFDWKFFNPQISDNSINYKRELYAYTNLFRLMFSMELSKKLKEKKYSTKSIACHPGVVKSNLGRHVFISKLIYKLPILPPTSYGVLPIYESLANPNLNGGEFIGFDTKNQWKGNPIEVEPNPICNDDNLRNLLWGKTSALTVINL
tara:strand:- start:3373 stop:4245 length:873 start_codon:yes stop_codon:yes gene_type:complete